MRERRTLRLDVYSHEEHPHGAALPDRGDQVSTTENSATIIFGSNAAAAAHALRVARVIEESYSDLCE